MWSLISNRSQTTNNLLYIDDKVHQLDLTAALAAVSDERRSYALRFRHEQGRRLCLAAFLLLQRALKEQYGIVKVPPFTYGANGKPSLEGFPHIHFNLSHCREAVACVVDDEPVGVDIESIGRYSPLLLDYTMSLEEQQRILQSPEPAAEFITLWTMKESRLKLTGEGITRDLHSVLADEHQYRFHTITRPDYIVTTCHHRH